MQIVYINNPSHDKFYCPVTGIPIFSDENKKGFFEYAESVIAVVGSDSYDEPIIKLPAMKKAWEEYFVHLRNKHSEYIYNLESHVLKFFQEFNHLSAIVFCFQWDSPLGSNSLFYVIDWDVEEN